MGEVPKIGRDSVGEFTTEVEKLDSGSGYYSAKAGFCEGFEAELASENVFGGNEEESGHLGIENGSQEFVIGGKEAEEERDASVRVGEENAVEVLKPVTEDEQGKFSGSPPLKTPEGDNLGVSSAVRIRSELPSADGALDGGRVGNGCKNVSGDCPSVKIGLESAKEVERNCSLNSEATHTEDKCEKLFILDSEKLNCSNEENLGSSAAGHAENAWVQKQCIGEPPEEVYKGDKCTSAHVVVQGLSSEAVFCSSTGLTFQQPPQCFTSSENCSLELLSVSGYKGCEVGGVIIGLASCFDRVNTSCGEGDNSMKDDIKSTAMIVSRRRNPKRSASLRSNLKDGKSEQLTRARNNGRKCRKKFERNAPLLLTTVKLSDKFKRKRSFRRRPTSLSGWGPVENIIKVFKQNGELETYTSDTIPVNNVRPRKRRSGMDRKKRPRTQKDGTEVSSTIQDTSSHQPMSHVVVDTRSYDAIAASSSQIDFGIASIIESKGKLAGDGCTIRATALQQDVQIVDKDLESTLTQETFVDHIVDECPGVSSQIGPEMLVEAFNYSNSLDPGTSPDSDVCHPMLDVGLMTSEVATSPNHASGTLVVGVVPSEDVTSVDKVSGMGQTVLVLESMSEIGVQVADPTSTKTFVNPLSVPPVDPELHTNRRGENSGKACGHQCPMSQCPMSELITIEDISDGLENLNKATKCSRYRRSKQKNDVANWNNQLCSKPNKTTRTGAKCRSFPAESSVLGIAELEHSEESMKVQNLETSVLSGQDTSNLKSEEIPMRNGIRGRKLPRSLEPRCNKNGFPGRASRRRTNVHGKKKENTKKSRNKCISKEKSGTFVASLDATDVMNFSSRTAKLEMATSTQFNSNTDAESKVVPKDVPGSVIIPVGDHLAPKECNNSLEEQSLSSQLAWVSCDDCQKWRCISVELANAIDETNCKWTCKDNSDKAFADCSLPQEKTNAEINAELGISDEDESSSAKPSSKGADPPKLAASLGALWNAIKSNVFLHRNRRSQTIDEIMVCHCKPPRDGSLGCGDQCLNRMLNIECVKGTCPCGDLCSNQQFQKRKYVNLKKFHCGKKGYGLQLQEGASCGKFLIEYVGEVLDLASYEGRQRYYASQGQKHFYFMTLNGGEVIDACAKGNLGRFVNHSCDPNCRTEKWMVNGEVCIGLFAIRDIKKGEEVTFDYNYVRVVGAAAKKCVCGSSECRGYIGGDPLNSEVVVQGDSDDEDIEPVVDHKVGKRELNLKKNSYGDDTEVVKKEQICTLREDTLVKCSPVIPEPKICKKIMDILCRPEDINQLDNPLLILDSIQSEDTISRSTSNIQTERDPKESLGSIPIEETVCKPVSDIQPLQISLESSTRVGERLSDSAPIGRKLITNRVEGKSNTDKQHSRTKSSRSSGKIKKGRSHGKHLVTHKPKKLTVGVGNGNFEGVEGKLNELLDIDGGISKQKDATRGYLKLLFVTAAEGDVRGSAFQSTRDLSLILDAILKTKSRKVLVDIINKNGLQMLHNIMKQNRSNFNRIPIIRKLLKVLEFIALKGILTLDQINRDPPCSGMESFKESILSLARHNDVQVQQIARNFRDKWIPRTIKKVEHSDRDGCRLDPENSCRSWFQSSSKLKYWHDQGAREMDPISTSSHMPASSVERDVPGEPSSLGLGVPNSAHVPDNSSTGATRTHKRKSRWGPPLDITSLDPQSLRSVDNIAVAGVKCMKLSSAQQEKTSQHQVSKQTSRVHGEGNSSCDEVASASNLMHQNANVEKPPGFGSQQQTVNVELPPGFGNLQQHVNFEASPGLGSPQKQHTSKMPFEISVASGEVVTGHLQERYLSDLPVSFGIPVSLMELGTLETEGGSNSSVRWSVAPTMPFHPFPPLPSYPHPSQEREQNHAGSSSGKTTPGTSEEPGHMSESCYRKSRLFGRLKWPSNGPARRFPHQERWNDRRFQRSLPPYPNQRIAQEFRGNIRHGNSNLGFQKISRDIRGGSCPSRGVSNDAVRSNFHQRFHHN